MKSLIAEQLPFLRGDNSCPVCKQRISKQRTILARLRANDLSETRIKKCVVPYCDRCELPFLSGHALKSIKDENPGLTIPAFTLGKKNTVEALELRISQFVYDRIRNHRPISKEAIGFEVVVDHPSYWKCYRSIFTISAGATVCPRCTGTLHEDYTLLPLSAKEKAVVPGLFCSACKRFYTAASQDVAILIRDNPLARGIKFNESSLWNISVVNRRRRAEQERRKKRQDEIDRRDALLKQFCSAALLIHIKMQRGAVQEYVIVNDKNEENIERSILHYTSAIARELLCAAFHHTRDNRQGTLNGEVFNIQWLYYPDQYDEELPAHMIARSITLDVGGGYFSSVKRGNQEIVDLLLYAPFKGSYEVIRATHNKTSNECFIDYNLFREFARKNGNPGLPYKDRVSFYKVRRWDSLQDESVLFRCHYTTAEEVGLSNRQRQEILADIVDLGICSVAQIVHLLEFFISSHPEDKYIRNCAKWAIDLKFIRNYRVNPGRFLAAQQ